MSAGTLCTRLVVYAAPGESVRDGARRMLKNNVGTLVVVDPERWPVGILTDRDIVTRVVAAGLDCEALTIGEIMSWPIRTVAESTPIQEALEIMRRLAVRRLVVTSDDGSLAGLLSLDDIIELLAEEAAAIASLLRKEEPLLGGPGGRR